MPLFRKKEKAKPSYSSAFRSVEHLPSSSSSSAPHFDHDNHNNQFPVSVPTSQQFPPQTQTQPQSQSQSHSSDSRHPPPRHPAHTSLQRSHTQRLRTPPDASALSNSTSTITSWPSSPTDKADDQEPRRSKRSLFSFHSSTSSSSVRDHQPSLLERNRSVKTTSTRRQSQQQQQQPPQRQQTQQQQQKSRSSVDIWSRDYVVDAPEAEHRPSMPQQSTGRAPDPGLAPRTRSPHPSPIPRSNTDPHLFDNIYHQAPVENSRHAADLAPATHQLDPRPPSRQSIGPPSPFPPTKSETSSVSQLGAMSDRPSGGTQQNSSQPASSQEAGFRNSAGQQQVAPETGRATPTSKDSRSRDDLGDIDVRTLLQKHEELQTKYSKVKRYYFERDAQVQQLQNTVAHQRMAVSRTVLDDNEYANRFGRLDGAIKDLAFSIRKDWKTIPGWLTGFVNEDAPSTGTKEMTAIGRALMSRWLVDEIFERYFHPVLEPAFSQQLKSIEMTLRRQQTNMATEEDKENSIARISNWRRTTLDGLGDSIHGPAADEYRAKLINRLVDNLVATLVTNLHDPPPPGLDNGARMIVENAVGITEKIPLESRDVCVNYIHPGTPVHEATMKIEPGVLPPLTNAASPDSHATRRSAEDHPHPHHPEHNTEDNAAVPSGDGDRDSSTNPGLDGVPAAREQRMRSVFSNIMGRKPGQGSPAGPTPPPTDGVRRGSVGGPGTGQAQAQAQAQTQGSGTGQGRIRLAAFITAEVRGRGPLNVLVKAPVYPME
ncbi:hypothetical protein BDW59DRAFT_20585 [Aspergillus cavernicola]|uniref:Uncharacterized protein n=1 Tax=Aspergillus cavernicola TaxID=176166 RepID=A0ABR4HGW9_9EURO